MGFISVSLVILWDIRSQVNIGSGNGLVPSGTKPLPEPMLTWVLIKNSHQCILCSNAHYTNHKNLLKIHLYKNGNPFTRGQWVNCQKQNLPFIRGIYAWGCLHPDRVYDQSLQLVNRCHCMSPHNEYKLWLKCDMKWNNQNTKSGKRSQNTLLANFEYWQIWEKNIDIFTNN